MIPFGSTATITPYARDSVGDRTAGTSTVVEGCAVWFTPGIETVGSVGGLQDTLIYDATVLLPPGTVVDRTCRIEVDGVTFEVISQPIDWRHPLTGWHPGVEVHCRKVVG